VRCKKNKEITRLVAKFDVLWVDGKIENGTVAANVINRVIILFVCGFPVFATAEITPNLPWR
jgi:hypothetical protein